MERNFKYFFFGLMFTSCGAISLLAMGRAISMIINLYKESGWWVVLSLGVIVFGIFCFLGINWLLGKMIYYGYHLNNKIYDKASNQELFEVVKHEKFYWNCTCEENKDEENTKEVNMYD